MSLRTIVLVFALTVHAGCSTDGSAACVAGVPCDSSNSCRTAATECESVSPVAVCVETGNAPDGTSCGAGRVCSAGACIVACEAGVPCQPENACAVGAIACASSWSPPSCNVTGNKADGTPCGNGGACASGICVGPAIARVFVADAAAVIGHQVTLAAEVEVASGTPSTEVEWSIPAGSGGTVDPVRGSTTTFTAPMTPGKYKIVAASVADPAKQDAAYVVVAPPPGVWLPGTPPPEGFGARAAATLHGTIYVLGSTFTDRPEPMLLAYDPHDDAWTVRTPPPVEISAAPVVAWNGRLYVTGGVIMGGMWESDWVYAYDPRADAWSTLASLPSFRRSHAAAAALEKLYAIGGFVGPEHILGASDNVEVYDPQLDDWTSGPALGSPRAAGAATSWYDALWVFGGLDAASVPVATVESFSVSAGAWSSATRLPRPRFGISAAQTAGKTYTLGGYESDGQGGETITAVVDAYDHPSGAWSAPPNMLAPRAYLASAAANGAVFAIGGMYGSVGPEVEAYTPPDTLGTIEQEVGSKPFGILFDGATLWVANAGSGTVSRVRPSDGAILGTIAVGPEPRGDMAFDGLHVWVTNTGSDTVTKIRATDGAVVGTFVAGASPHGAAFDGVHVWVANWAEDSVAKLRASDGVRVGSYSVGRNPSGVAWDGDSIWVSTRTEITWLRASDGSRLGGFAPVDDPYGIVFDGTSIWFANHGSNTVTKVRPSDGAHLGTYVVGASPIGIATAGSRIWVANSGDHNATELRADDGATVCTLKVGAAPYGIAYVDGHPWVTRYDATPGLRRLY